LIQKSPDDFEEDDFRRSIPRYSKENFPNILKIVDGLKVIGSKHNATPGQVALAWLLGQGEDVIPIPGTRKIKVSTECTLTFSPVCAHMCLVSG
jgi:aryl-alcohol dehydrogenase-like predicted oxidoreductase